MTGWSGTSSDSKKINEVPSRLDKLCEQISMSFLPVNDSVYIHEHIFWRPFLQLIKNKIRFAKKELYNRSEHLVT